MLKIELNGTLCITDDLASRLRSRGLLSISGECTEDFVVFLQECVARDDGRCSILADKTSSNISLPSAATEKANVDKDVTEHENEALFEDDSEDAQESESTVEHKPSALQNSLNSLVDESDLAALRQGLSTLYQGG